MGLKIMARKIVRNKKKIILTRYENGQHHYDGARYSESDEFECVKFAYAAIDYSHSGTPVLSDFMLKFAIDNKLRPGDKLEVSLKVVK
jgi:hypothetical protein